MAKPALKDDAPSPFVSLEAFREAAKAANDSNLPLVDPRVRASWDTEVKASEEPGQERTLIFTISTPNRDRGNDTIALDGWKLENYRKNPVVLWAHDATSPPIAKSNKIWTESSKLKSEAEFVPADNPATGRFAEGIFQLYKGGFMAATSVGFQPMKYAFRDDPGGGWGIDFMEQELLEYSCVPIPANAEALLEGKAAGIDIGPVLDFCMDTLLKSQDGARVIKLAESVLGANGQDMASIAWAEKIVSSSGKCIVSKARIEALERAATKARLARNRQRQLDVLALGPK